jgi:alanine racemase
MNDLQKRTWAEISLANIRHNYEAIRAALPAGCRFLGVVKADAYGHGALPVSRLLQDAGADYLAVSCLDEAMELRRGGIRMPVLILGHTPPEYTELLIDQNITQTVSALAKAREYSAAAAALGKTLKVHLKLDTGMSRLGFLCAGDYYEKGVENVIASCKLPNLESEGVYTHFAVSDEDGKENEAYTREQFRLFCAVIDAARERGGVEFAIRHCANSGAVLHYPEMALDMVRPGLLLYGYGDNGQLGLRPCMRLVTTVSTIKHYEAGTSVSYGRHFVTGRHTRMGVLAIGYADGLPRILSNRCSFYTVGGMAPQRGNICMDMCMADLTELPQVDVGSEVEIFGEHNSVEELAAAAGTISYELLCAVSKRVPRVYGEETGGK